MIPRKNGSRVSLKKEALELPYMQECINLYEHMSGIIVGMTVAGDKYAVEFDDRIFSNSQYSYFNSGCHGKGALSHCAYIPVDMVWGEIKGCLRRKSKEESLAFRKPEVVGFINLDTGLDNALIALL